MILGRHGEHVECGSRQAVGLVRQGLDDRDIETSLGKRAREGAGSGRAMDASDRLCAMPTKYWIVKAEYVGESGDSLYWVADDGVSSYQVFKQGQWKGPWRSVTRIAGSEIRAALTVGGVIVRDIAASPYQPGQYHPRMWRPDCFPAIREKYDIDFHSAQGAALNLFGEMKDVFRFVEPSGNRTAYGHEIRQLLILACTEVEAQCKAVLRENHYTRKNSKGGLVGEKYWRLDDFFRTARPLRLAGWNLKVRGHPTFPVLDPFAPWGTGTYAPLPWYSAYNAVKHDREREFAEASLENMVSAMAAVHLLVVAQFGHFGHWYHSGYSDVDVFDVTAPRPAFDLAERYVSPQVGGLAEWSAVDYPF